MLYAPSSTPSFVCSMAVSALLSSYWVMLRACHDGRLPAAGGGVERRRTGIEPARPSCSVSSVLKTAGATRHPDASPRGLYHAARATLPDWPPRRGTGPPTLPT